MIRRLHWGCGPKTPYGWVNSDIAPFPGVDVVADILSGLPFPDNSFDVIVSIHVLPEIPYRSLPAALSELRRVLCPGGVLRLALPDMNKAIQAYRNDDVDYFFLIPDEEAYSISSKMITQLLWYGQSRTLFTPEFAREALTKAAYIEISDCAFRVTESNHPGITDLDDRELESFFIEARKPTTP